MKAQRIIVKLKQQNIYNTEQGLYEPSAALTDKGELLVTLKFTTPQPDEFTSFITMHFTKNETRIIRNALNVTEAICR